MEILTDKDKTEVILHFTFVKYLHWPQLLDVLVDYHFTGYNLL